MMESTLVGRTLSPLDNEGSVYTDNAQRLQVGVHGYIENQILNDYDVNLSLGYKLQLPYHHVSRYCAVLFDPLPS